MTTINLHEIDPIESARTADQWWAWHDQSYDRASADMETAEARCAEWVAGESDDGPESR